MGVAPQHLDKTYLAKQLNTSKSSYIEHDAPKTIRTLPFLQQGISRNEALNTKKKIIRYKLIPGTKVKHETLCYREGKISNSNDKMMLLNQDFSFHPSTYYFTNGHLLSSNWDSENVSSSQIPSSNWTKIFHFILPRTILLMAIYYPATETPKMLAAAWFLGECLNVNTENKKATV